MVPAGRAASPPGLVPRMPEPGASWVPGAPDRGGGTSHTGLRKVTSPYKFLFPLQVQRNSNSGDLREEPFQYSVC